MSIYSNMQICGSDHKISVNRHNGMDWVNINHAGGSITLNPCHVRALAAALDAYESAQALDAAE
tara:strand:+ start:795 stop:986 length:192 start_codon:yes stop_codon:yes gene_type:complete